MVLRLLQWILQDLMVCLTDNFPGLPTDSLQLGLEFPFYTIWGSDHQIIMGRIVPVPGQSILFSSFLSSCQFSTCFTLNTNYWANKLLCLGYYYGLWKQYLILFISSISGVHQTRKSILSWNYFHQVQPLSFSKSLLASLFYLVRWLKVIRAVGKCSFCTSQFSRGSIY